jgi:hypothetical protein
MGNIRLVYDVDEDSADYHAHRLQLQNRKEILAYQKEIRTITTSLLQGAAGIHDRAADVTIDRYVSIAQAIYLRSLSLSPPEK